LRDTLIFDPEDANHTTTSNTPSKPGSTRLDPEGKEHRKATLEGLLLRTEARRWTA
jgi:hypothetical protein